MGVYNPHRWVIIFINGPDPHYRVLAGWSGDYLNGPSWRMNSGIVSVSSDEDYWYFHGSSGSIYNCSKNGYGWTSMTSEIFNDLNPRAIGAVSVLDENNDWNKMDWIISR